MGSKIQVPAARTGSAATASTLQKPSYHLPKKTTFRSAVYARLDNPLTSLYRLGIRILQLVFALASGISYAIELANGHNNSNMIYSQVVFGLTFITLVVDAVTIRTYHLIFIIESVVCVLWVALFGVFYSISLSHRPVESGYDSTHTGRMKAVVWIDLINALLWLASALFSSVMCCSGIKGAIKGKLEHRRVKKGKSDSTNQMEEGIVHENPDIWESERLPLYEEIVTAARAP